MLPEHSFNFSSDLGPDLGHHFDPGYGVYGPVSPGPGMWAPSVMKQDAGAYLQSSGANTFLMDTMERSPGQPGQGGFTLGDLAIIYVLGLIQFTFPPDRPLSRTSLRSSSSSDQDSSVSGGHQHQSVVQQQQQQPPQSQRHFGGETPVIVSYSNPGNTDNTGTVYQVD